MKMNSKKILYPLLFSGILLASCSKSEQPAPLPATNTGTGNNTGTGTTGGGTGGSGTAAVPPSLDFGLRVSNTSAGINRKATAGSSIQWTAGFANPVLVKVEAKRGGSEIEFKSANTGQIDLFAAATTLFGNFTLPAGTYSEVELKLQLKKGAGPALELSGVYLDSSSAATPVVFRINDFVELKTEAHNVTIDSSAFDAITTIDLSALTSGVTDPMIRAASLTGGTLVISDASNKAIYQIILDNIDRHRHHAQMDHHH